MAQKYGLCGNAGARRVFIVRSSASRLRQVAGNRKLFRLDGEASGETNDAAASLTGTRQVGTCRQLAPMGCLFASPRLWDGSGYRHSQR
jgi:hypothetical protein